MIKEPSFRKLRGYAFDPSLSLKMDTAPINDLVYKVPWEDVMEGPIGEYVEVVDYDPTVGKFYRPVDLNNPFVLASDGLEPSESNPQFHQQMVYAVVMTTIKNFEKALGRKILWSPRRVKGSGYEEPVMKLRIYPHALREANAYYSPVKKALLFGYFSSTPADESLHMPDSLVFTCLSHDIVAHETTHAILDGLHSYYNVPSNPDMLAFHEAFADIVALFQHFSFPDVLKHQIAKTKGDLGSQNLLGQLAQEFGSAIGNYGSLRDAIGKVDEETKKWKPIQPNPDDYRTITEPHARGSILVAAVFEAFLSIYQSRINDLIRIASDGTGILRQGEIHPDLVNRLANEASKAAGHVLRMCIRALDYCPPVDLNFGDYLRAIITADSDLVAEDNRDYRLAFIDSFRKRGIYPSGIKTLSVESLRHTVLNIGGIRDEAGNMEVEESEVNLTQPNMEIADLLSVINGFLREYAEIIKYENNRKRIFETTRKYIRGEYSRKNKIILGLHKRLNLKFNNSIEFSKITGLDFDNQFKKIGISKSLKYNGASFRIQNLRLVSRVGPEGNQINHVIFSLVQTSGVIYKDGKFAGHYQPENDYTKNTDRKASKVPEGGFELKGGCTLIFDLDSLKLKYAISKPIMDMDQLEKTGKATINLSRADAQYKFMHQGDEDGMNEFTSYFSNDSHGLIEPFAFLHQH